MKKLYAALGLFSLAFALYALADGVIITTGGSSGSGSGDVTGPNGATANAIARFSGATGKAIKNSVCTIDDSGLITGCIGMSGAQIDLTASTPGGYVGMTAGTATNFFSQANGFEIYGAPFYLDQATASTVAYWDANKNLKSSPVTTTQLASLPTQVYSNMIEVPTDKSYTLDLFTAYSGTINTLKIITASGTTTAAVKINGTSVTGISAVSVSNVIATGTATAANTFSAGDKLSLVLSGSAVPTDLAYTLKITR